MTNNVDSNDNVSNTSDNSTAKYYNMSKKGIYRLKDVKLDSKIIKLDCSFNKIEFIDSDDLNNIKNLNSLKLTHNYITKIEHFDSLKNLQKLNLDQNLISVLENIENISDLRYLSVSNNRIHSIFIKKPLISLKYLNMSYNPIMSFNFGKMFPKLQMLEISGCYITDISCFNRFESLNKLIVSNNRLFGEASLNLLSLKHLNVSCNNYTDLDFVHGTPNLEYLDISNNAITNKCLKGGVRLKNLKTIKLVNTGLVQDEDFMKAFPSVQNVISTEENIKIEDVDSVSLMKKIDKIRELREQNEKIKAKLENRKPIDTRSAHIDINNIDSVLSLLIAENKRIMKIFNSKFLEPNNELCQMYQEKILLSARTPMIPESSITLKRTSEEFKLVKIWLSLKMQKEFKVLKIVKICSFRKLINLEKKMRWFNVVITVDSFSVLSDHMNFLKSDSINSFLICAYDSGKVIVDHNTDYNDTDKLMILNREAQTLLFTLRGHPALFTKDQSRVVPLYSVSIKLN